MADPVNPRERRAAQRMGWSRALAFCLGRSRFSVILLLVGLALVLSDQGRDLLVACGEDGKTGRVAGFAFGWAVSLWAWARLLLEIRYPEAPRDLRAYGFFREWTPRVLGCLAFAVVVLGALRAGQVALAVWGLGALLVFAVLVTLRRRLSRALARALRKLPGPFPAWADRVELPPLDVRASPPHADLGQALHIGGGWRRWYRSWRALLAVVTLVAFAVLFVLALRAPVWLGARLGGAMGLVFLWAITLLPVGTLLGYAADRIGLPLLSTLAVVAALSSFWNDNHRIRRLDHENARAIESRQTVGEALAGWGERNPPPGSGGGAPFVLVATAGGGIRAAYWTATVLGLLQDLAPQFRDRTFAVSGVSGGSVGATVFRALLPMNLGAMPDPCRAGVRACGRAVLGHEFLGPLSAAMLYPDLAQRFWPVAMFPDRGEALEESWEAAFREVTGADGLNASLAGLPGPGPHLFLNATWADNGRRIVASDLRFGAEGALRRANDELAELGHDLRLSTAAHNSARFPFVSPPGMWRDRATGRIAGRLQDGGLFENYGAETAMDLLDEACSHLGCGSCRPDGAPVPGSAGPRIRPVVVVISSDPSLPADFASSPHYPPIGFGYELRTTFLTYERVRGGRGSEAVARLDDAVRARCGEVFQFRMCQRGSSDPQPPLGWALSEAARTEIDGYLFASAQHDRAGPPCLQENSRAASDLVTLLAGAPPAAAGR